MSYMLQPQIILLKDGTDDSQGINQIVSNINACQAIADMVKSTLGPCGMDKMIQTQKGHTISNDGATILNLLDVEHPAARILVEISKSQDDEVGDGTTSVTIFASELLQTAKQFIQEGINPQFVTKVFKKSGDLLQKFLIDLSVEIDIKDKEARNVLVKCAETALNSKLLSHYKTFFGEMVVKAVETLDTNLLEKELIGIKQILGGSIKESFLVDGVAFEKTFSYAGFEQQPKRFTNPKVILLNIELELKAEKETAEIRIENPDQFQSIVDAEWKIIYNKLEKIVESGAQIVLSQLPIGDLATQYFADRNIFCAGRVQKDDIRRVEKATGAKVLTTLNDLRLEQLGTCELFEEKRVGASRYNFFTGCPASKTATIILRGGAEQFLKEAERSLNDSIMIVRRVAKSNIIIPGGGAIEMELSKLLRQESRKIKGKEHLIMHAYAKALEIIPRCLAENGGLQVNDVLNQLRRIHAQETDGQYWGVNVFDDVNSVQNTYKNFVWEPLLVKSNYLKAANELACMILSIDETIKAPQNEEERKMRKQVLPGPQGKAMMQNVQ